MSSARGLYFFPPLSSLGSRYNLSPLIIILLSGIMGSCRLQLFLDSFEIRLARNWEFRSESSRLYLLVGLMSSFLLSLMIILWQTGFLAAILVKLKQFSLFFFISSTRWQSFKVFSTSRSLKSQIRQLMLLYYQLQIFFPDDIYNTCAFSSQMLQGVDSKLNLLSTDLNMLAIEDYEATLDIDSKNPALGKDYSCSLGTYDSSDDPSEATIFFSLLSLVLKILTVPVRIMVKQSFIDFLLLQNPAICANLTTNEANPLINLLLAIRTKVTIDPMQVLSIIGDGEHILELIIGDGFGMIINYLVDGLGEVEMEFIGIFQNKRSMNWLRFDYMYF